MKKILIFGLAFFASLIINAQIGVGVNTNSPDPSAILDVVSTEKGFLPPRLTNAAMTTLAGTAAEGLVVFCTDCAPVCLYFYNGTEFQSLCGGDGDALPFESILAVDGREWADRNLGATAAATSINDPNPDAQGGYYQWGRSTDGHELPTSSVVTGPLTSEAAANGSFINTGNDNWITPNDPTLWNDSMKGSNDPCPDGWRVPSRNEINGLSTAIRLAAGVGTTTVQLFFDEIKLHAGRRRNPQGNGFTTGTIALWTSTESNADTGRSFEAPSTGPNDPITANTKRKGNGLNIRCIKEQ